MKSKLKLNKIAIAVMALSATTAMAQTTGSGNIDDGTGNKIYGNDNYVSSSDSIVVGDMNYDFMGGANNHVFGNQNIGQGLNPVSYNLIAGDQNTYEHNYGVGLGYKNGLYGDYAIAIGSQNEALIRSVVIGSESFAGDYSISLGYKASSNLYGIAIGDEANVFGISSIAIGQGSIANDPGVVSFGHGGAGLKGPATRRLINVAAGTNATDAVNKAQLDAAIAGVSGGSFDPNQTVFGASNTVPDGNYYVLGDGNVGADGGLASQSTVLIGRNNNAAAGSSNMIGYGNTGVARGTNIVGDANIAQGNGGAASQIFGRSNIDYGGGLLSGTYNTSKSGSNVLLGAGNLVDTLAGQSVAIGFDNVIGSGAQFSVGIGRGTKVTGQKGVAVGDYAEAGLFSAAFGAGAGATGNYSVALGYIAKAPGANSVAIGNGSRANDDNVFSIGGGSGSVYGPATRRIINVTDGINDSDAATLGQVKTLIAAVDTGGGPVIDQVARDAAAAAQTTADGAVAAAAAADAKAVAAQTTADGAVLAASNADAKAVAAQTTADGAALAASTASSDANLAKLTADAASAKVDSAIATLSSGTDATAAKIAADAAQADATLALTGGANDSVARAAATLAQTDASFARTAAVAAQADATRALTGDAFDRVARDRVAAVETRVDAHAAKLSEHDDKLVAHDTQLADHESRIATLESAPMGGFDEVARQGIADLDKKIGAVEKKAMQGVAAAMATNAALPSGSDLQPGERIMSIGVGAYGGQAALAMGVAQRLKSAEFKGVVFRAAVAITGGRAAVSAGMGWRF